MRLVAAVPAPRPPPGPAHVAVRHADTRAARAAADPHLAPPRGARGRGLVTAARAVRPPVTHLPRYCRDIGTQNSRRTCFVRFTVRNTWLLTCAGATHVTPPVSLQGNQPGLWPHVRHETRGASSSSSVVSTCTDMATRGDNMVATRDT